MTKKRAPRIQIQLTEEEKALLYRLAGEQDRKPANLAALFVRRGLAKLTESTEEVTETL